ncbi:YndJ family protein [Cytobacillus purgationiresistens]|uniref:YndJ-like protein n=1 Tax=Cytobacillus purgationiresistens TaxID=863449 RepID=A0ABU0AEQ5_9BACI|nr:YndJ family protein [Cytobacillus purgationiresistens]MDQ0269744.1 hypothetical protein [Cytobacillus purgationiresistens]
MNRKKGLLLLSVGVFLLTAAWGESQSYLLMLTVAQLVYIPIVLIAIMDEEDWFAKYYLYLTFPAYISVMILYITESTAYDIVLGAVYLAYTFIVAFYGFYRFCKRGFIRFEEFMIDAGLVYLSIGGIWFFAHIAEIDTGFSPIITWLTSIHFHYSAFLLPVFMGFLGRVNKSSSYPYIGSIILLAPIILAAGITFSVWIEILSVIFYLIGIYSLIFLSIKTQYENRLQQGLIILSFSSLGITILFSFLYAIGQLWRDFSLSIPFMLQFHGFFNCVVFAFCGLIGWMLALPSTKHRIRRFSRSQIRGSINIGENLLSDITAKGKYSGLVNSMKKYQPHVQMDSIHPTIIHFYENTLNYRLFAKVEWKSWFKPFAIIYHLISKRVQQINLPLSSKEVEMTGDILPVNMELDGRPSPRAWLRKVEDEVAFVAIYSWHETKGRRYMNIALPLPFTSMVGVLELNTIGDELELTSIGSNEESDAGIYLLWRGNQMVLPIQESFRMTGTGDGTLKASHHMWIFGLSFLKIEYKIVRKSENEF